MMQKLNIYSKRVITIVVVFVFAVSLILLALCNRENITKLIYKCVSESDNGHITVDTGVSTHTTSSASSSVNALKLLASGFVDSLTKPHAAAITDTKDIEHQDYLLNISFLVMNFLQDKNYTDQLQTIEVDTFPSEIQNILADFGQYARYLQSDGAVTERIFPRHVCWIDQFIKIEKKSDIEQDKEKLRLKIIANLEFFMRFFFTHKTQSTGVTND